jgi:hypothetical protein
MSKTRYYILININLLELIINTVFIDSIIKTETAQTLFWFYSFQLSFNMIILYYIINKPNCINVMANYIYVYYIINTIIYYITVFITFIYYKYFPISVLIYYGITLIINVINNIYELYVYYNKIRSIIYKSDIILPFNQTDCIICINNFNNNDILIKLNCNHYFHKECISNWFIYRPHCPICLV